MALQCDNCGIESHLETAFHRERLFRGKERILCPPCWSKQQTSLSKRSVCAIILFGFVWLFMAIPALEVKIYFYLLLTLFFPLLVILPHELGHALSAKMLGLRVYMVLIGDFGKAIYKRQIGRCSFEIRLPARIRG